MLAGAARRTLSVFPLLAPLARCRRFAFVDGGGAGMLGVGGIMLVGSGAADCLARGAPGLHALVYS